jgi:hypothetical protein
MLLGNRGSRSALTGPKRDLRLQIGPRIAASYGSSNRTGESLNHSPQAAFRKQIEMSGFPLPKTPKELVRREF